MSLHGFIEVNNERIGFWSAQRIMTGDPNVYKCEVVTPFGQRLAFRIEHDYAEGAVALAAKVLSAANGDRPGCSPDCTSDHAPCTRQRWLETPNHDAADETARDHDGERDADLRDDGDIRWKEDWK